MARKCSDITASDLRERVTFQSAARVSDAQGGTTPTWSEITNGEVWARVKEMSATERFFSHKREENITHEITIRYRTDLDTGMRVLWGSRILQIQGKTNKDMRKKYLTVSCVEGKAS